MAVYSLEVGGRQVSYQLRSVVRSRSIRIRISAKGEVVVTKPKRLHRFFAQKFVAKNIEWIAGGLERHSARVIASGQSSLPYVAEVRRRALQLAAARVQHFNRHYDYRVGMIRIRNQRTRWGSCSARGNLSFNYRISTLPPRLADYLVVHELCHVREHNHSPRFWALVAQSLPDYADRRAELRAMPLV